MSRVILEVPDEALSALQLPPDQFGEELRMAAAAKLYELNHLSSGAAAALAGVGDYGVDTFRLSEEDLRQETRLV